MNKVKVYLNLDFILRFGCIRPKDQMGDDYLNWLILSRSLIRNHIELNKLDTNSFNAVSLNKDEFIRFVSSNNNSEIELSATIDVNKAREFILKNYNPHMLLLLETDKETIEQLQCEFGIWVMNTSTLLNSFLGTKNGIGVPNNVNRTTGHIKSWDFLSQFKHPFGGIIIVDRYFFSFLDYRANLDQILKQLTKQKLVFPIHITIIYQKDCVPRKIQNISLLYRDAIQICKKTLKQGKFELSIIQVELVPETHDRRIITNYMFILSGTSFQYSTNIDPINVKPNFRTHLTFHDTLTKETIDDILDDLNYVRNISSEKGFQSTGVNINRLVQGKL